LLTKFPTREFVLSDRRESKDLSSNPKKDFYPEGASRLKDLSSVPLTSCADDRVVHTEPSAQFVSATAELTTGDGQGRFMYVTCKKTYAGDARIAQ